eukprot:COSAG06_NODE_3636_length_5090_cov_2.096574_7_plen_61_part_01
MGGVDHWLLLLAAWHAGGVQIEHYKYKYISYYYIAGHTQGGQDNLDIDISCQCPSKPGCCL